MKKLVYWGVGILYCLALLLFVFTCRDAMDDVFVRYGPMAEAFAKGNWQEAFHPRFGVAFQVITGLFVFLSGGMLDGWDACVLVSTLALVLSTIPFFKLAKRIFDETTAWFAVVLLAISPQVLLWVSQGLRESFRMLGTLLLCEALFACKTEEGKWRGLLGASLGVFILCSTRVDTIAAAFLLVLIYFIVDKFSKRSWILAGVTFLAIQPSSFLVWKWTGWWLPAIQYISILKKVVG